jgi:hypothetical protein
VARGDITLTIDAVALRQDAFAEEPLFELAQQSASVAVGAASFSNGVPDDGRIGRDSFCSRVGG